MSAKQYIIKWERKDSLGSDRTCYKSSGQGYKLFTLEEARALTTELNETYPEINHFESEVSYERNGNPVEQTNEMLPQ